MILHLNQILSTASSVMLRTVDTDVLVLAISESAKYDHKYIFVDFGIGENRKMLSAHNIQLQIGKDKADILHVFHAQQNVTRCHHSNQ